MLETLFTWVTKLLSGHPLLGLLGAFIWGILSILLSPCHLASIPLIVGFISQQERTHHAQGLPHLAGLRPGHSDPPSP